MPKHARPETPQQSNTIMHQGARPLPDGNIELMVLIRLFDATYQLTKVVTLAEYRVIVEGFDLCNRTAVHQTNLREIQAAREHAAAESSSPRSDSAPPAAPERFTGSMTAPIKAPGARG